MKKRGQQRLGERELDIMTVLWQRKNATVTEVRQALLSQGHKLAYTTIQTMLNRLEGKALVARDSSDRTHRYRPLLKEPIAVSGALRRLTDRFFSGSVEALAVRLVESELSREQLERIQALIDGHKRKESAR